MSNENKPRWQTHAAIGLIIATCCYLASLALYGIMLYGLKLLHK